MPDKAIITLECFNGPNGSHPTRLFEYVQMDAHGIGQASSFPVQFNINTEAVEGAIFVNEENNGMAVARIQGDYLFIENEAWVEFKPDGFYTYDKPDLTTIKEIVSIKKPVFFTNKQIIFSISQNQISALRGSITVTFFVKYKRGV